MLHKNKKNEENIKVDSTEVKNALQNALEKVEENRKSEENEKSDDSKKSDMNMKPETHEEEEIRVLTIPIRKMKEIALKALKGHWKEVSFAALIFYLIRSVGDILDNYLIASPTPELVELFAEKGATLQPVPYGGSIYELLILGPISFGLAIFLLTFFRTKKCDNTLLFDGFQRFGKTFTIFIITGIKVFLWTLLFVFPGIIAAIRYSMAYYIAADHPEYTANQCINASKKIMTGNISVFLTMYITFIGWIVIGSIPSLIFDEYLKMPGLTGVFASIILGLPLVLVNVYLNTTKTVFYELLTGNLVVMKNVKPLQKNN